MHTVPGIQTVFIIINHQWAGKSAASMQRIKICVSKEIHLSRSWMKEAQSHELGLEVSCVCHMHKHVIPFCCVIVLTDILCVYC